MAEFALERDVLERASERVVVVKPEVALLPKADFVTHALVVLDRCAAERDIHALPPCGAHAARVFFARAEATAEIDIDAERLESALCEAHRDGAADDARADDNRFEALTCNHVAILAKWQS